MNLYEILFKILSYVYVDRLPQPLPDIIIYTIEGAIFFAIAGLLVAFTTWFERKTLARMQIRYGPVYVAPRFGGILQPFADLFKFLVKEDIVPKRADSIPFTLVPFLLLTTLVITIVAIPLSDWLYVKNISTGILFVYAFFSTMPALVMIAGWAQNNKYTMIGAFRAAAQMLSYEIPILLSIVGVVAMTGSFSLYDIASAQKGFRWFVFPQFLGAMAFLIGLVAETERLPFDLPEAETELVGGWHTEYSGVKFMLIYFSEYVRAFLGAAIAVLLFFGGWHGPFSDIPLVSIFWMMVKTYIIIFVIVWLRGALPRVRIDQLLRIGWKFLIPATLLNILLIPLIVRVFSTLGWVMP